MINVRRYAMKAFRDLAYYVEPGEDKFSGGTLNHPESEVCIHMDASEFRVVAETTRNRLKYQDIAKFYLPFDKGSKEIILESFDGNQYPLKVEDPYAFHRFTRSVRKELVRDLGIPVLSVEYWGRPDNYSSLSPEERFAVRSGETP